MHACASLPQLEELAGAKATLALELQQAKVNPATPTHPRRLMGVPVSEAAARKLAS